MATATRRRESNARYQRVLQEDAEQMLQELMDAVAAGPLDLDNWDVEDQVEECWKPWLQEARSLIETLEYQRKLIRAGEDTR